MAFWDLETRRKTLHLLSGVAFAATVHFLEDPSDAFIFLFTGAVLTLIFSYEISEGKKVPIVSWVVKKTERANRAPGSGVTWYFLGVLVMFVLFYYQLGVPKQFIVASMLVLAIGDGVSTGLGRKLGKRLLPKTKTKSWAGTGLGFLLSFFALPFVFSTMPGIIDWHVILLSFAGSFVGMLTEAYSPWVNDNLSIPLTSCAAITGTAWLLGLFP
jgi:dolichol kinase